jgi:hypothetical protein
MQDGTAMAEKNCARCYKPLNRSVVYRDQALWHAHCWQEGEHLLANATRIARAVTPPVCVPERPPLTNPSVSSTPWPVVLTIAVASRSNYGPRASHA